MPMFWRIPVRYEILVFLILSYVILIVNRKAETKNVRLLGNLIVLLLWVAALMSLGKGIYFLANASRMPLMSPAMHDFSQRHFSSGRTMPRTMMPFSGEGQASRSMTPHHGKEPLQQPCAEKRSGNAGVIAGTPPEQGTPLQKEK